MTGGSQQLRIFRRALHIDGATIEDAAALACMAIGEARLHAAADAREPPPAEAFELLPTTGHNKPPETETMADTSDDRLRLLIERIERLEEEKKGIGDDIKDVYSEAKATGYDAKILRKVIAIRKMKPDDRNEFATVLETYLCSLGIQIQGTLF